MRLTLMVAPHEGPWQGIDQMMSARCAQLHTGMAAWQPLIAPSGSAKTGDGYQMESVKSLGGRLGVASACLTFSQ